LGFLIFISGGGNSLNFFRQLKESLVKTRQNFVGKIESLLLRRKIIDEELYEELEDSLIQADLGVETALKLMERVRAIVKEQKVNDPLKLKDILKEELILLLGEEYVSLNTNDRPLSVLLIVGVNGAGKTTTIGKLAYHYHSQGKKVLLAAADTFRAAAIEQLEIWKKRARAELIKHQEGSDPAAVAFDAIQAARSRKANIVIIDTAGRLHTKTNLMEELKKVSRVVGRELPGAPHEVLLVLDATTGQNAISQAKLFNEAIGISGLILAKLDGTAKGGMVFAIKQELNIPVKLIGTGEGIEDLQVFRAREFVEALFE